MAVRTLAGSTISLIPASEGVYINIQGSSKKHVVKVDKSDLMVVNGVVHSVEHVLTANEGIWFFDIRLDILRFPFVTTPLKICRPVRI